MSAANPHTVTVSGSSLDKLSKDNFAIEGNTVTSYEVSDNKNEATIQFENNFKADVAQTLDVTETVNVEIPENK